MEDVYTVTIAESDYLVFRWITEVRRNGHLYDSKLCLTHRAALRWARKTIARAKTGKPRSGWAMEQEPKRTTLREDEL
jgi:hypothetical protein